MLQTVKNSVKNFVKNEDGQGLVEYIVIAAIIVVAIILVMTGFKGAISEKFNEINSKVKGA